MNLYRTVVGEVVVALLAVSVINRVDKMVIVDVAGVVMIRLE
jgi:hypothetical protein